jgi:probable phosphoglycerate mutase
MDRKIYLVRHGKIDDEGKKQYIGTTDLPLSNEGIEQAKKLKDYFQYVNVKQAYVSPLKRCLQTSEIILEGKKIDPTVLDDLKEIHMGTWEGKTFEYIKKQFPILYEERGSHIATFMPPMGESFEMLQARVLPAFENIIKISSGNILIVAHAGVNRVILSTILGIHLNKILIVEQPYGCINVLSWDIRQQKWHCETKHVNEI